MDHITIIGKSKVGTSLAKALRTSKDVKLSAIVSARSKVYPAIDSEVIIIAAKDDQIASVAQKAASVASSRLRLMVHLAGSLPSTILPARSGVSRLTLHPIQTIPKPDANLLHGIYWMASSDNASAIRWAKKFISNLGGKGVIVLPSEDLPLYHAMTVFGSNFITLLFSAIEDISAALGQDPKRMKAALRPLAEKSLQQALTKPAKEVLTGPMARRDFATIRKHQQALQALDPKLKCIYDALFAYAIKRKIGPPKNY